MKNFIFYSLDKSCKDCNCVLYFDSFTLVKNAVFSELEKLLVKNSSLQISVVTDFPSDKPFVFSIHRHDLSIITNTDK